LLIGGGLLGLVGVLVLLCAGIFLFSQVWGNNGTPEAEIPVEATAVILVADVTLPAGEDVVVAATSPESVPATATATTTATPPPAPTQPPPTSTPTSAAATATTAPLVTPTAAATAVPTTAPTIPPTAVATAEPYVRITNITISGDRYAVYYETPGYTPNVASLHIHFFFNTVRPENAGTQGSGGTWILYDLPVPFTGYGPGDRPAEATQMCALVANANHSVRLGTGNCFNLP
jgi:hypothetical protein